MVMDPPSPDGLSTESYTNSVLVGATQSPSASDYTGIGSYYTTVTTPTMPQPLPQTGSLPSAQRRHPRTAIQNQNPPHAAFLAGQYETATWTSSPTEASEDFENYSYGASPTYRVAQPSYDPSTLSPRTWSHSAEQMTYSARSDSLLQQQRRQHLNTLHICAPVQQAILPPYSGGFHHPFDAESTATTHSVDSPAMMSDAPDPGTTRSTSPGELGSMAKLEVGFDGADDDLQSPRPATEAEEEELAGPSSKAEEPYAQLIYRAFMSQPRHAMTLQEIYQWFRENTDKANSESKGWQNSIRHNLSMNAVSSFP
jgi:Forkhead domain